MKKIKIAGLVVAMFLGMSGHSQASNSDMNPWMECGIGAMIFRDHPVAAAVSNIIWDLGTTAVISMAASPETCEGSKAKSAQFIYETYANIEAETAIGQGQHLSAVLNLLGCDFASHTRIITAVRSDFRSMISAESYGDMNQLDKAKTYYDILQNQVSGPYVNQCKAG